MLANKYENVRLVLCSKIVVVKWILYYFQIIKNKVIIFSVQNYCAYFCLLFYVNVVWYDKLWRKLCDKL